MSTTTKRSRHNFVGTVDDLIRELENDCKEREARNPATTFDMIRAIHPTLVGMKAKGWTDADVCDALGKRGLVISAGTFATYMKRINREQREGRAKPGRKPKNDSRTPGSSKPPRAAEDSPVHQKNAADDSTDSNAHSSSRPPVDSGATRPAAPTMMGFTSRKPPSLDA
ncbi:hypothetical protein AA12717_3741 [Gluconacetobacter sacchari DSM 12717]|nr:hypothetical protein AA12717_3741 [Gluconacetobacter sacchari DSM 12717]